MALGPFFGRHRWRQLVDPTSARVRLSPAARGGLEEALTRLYVLDALDADGDITPIGRQMANLPLEPAVARALLAAHDLGWALWGGRGEVGVRACRIVFLGPHVASMRAARK
jgi:hypothetical protein